MLFARQHAKLLKDVIFNILETGEKGLVCDDCLRLAMFLCGLRGSLTGQTRLAAPLRHFSALLPPNLGDSHEHLKLRMTSLCLAAGLTLSLSLSPLPGHLLGFHSFFCFFFFF